MKKKILFLLISFLPVVVLADWSLSNGASTFHDAIFYVLDVLYILIPILFTLAFIVFFWGLSKFILSSGNQADLEKGKNYMIWGVLALFILLSFRAILSLVSNEFEFGGARAIPLLNTGGSATPPAKYDFQPSLPEQGIKLPN